MKQKVRQNDFVRKFSDLENYYATNTLKGDLFQVYKGVQSKCQNFRTKIFDKNLALLDSKLARSRHHSSASYDLRLIETEHEKLLRKIKSPQELLDEYTIKANEEMIEE